MSTRRFSIFSKLQICLPRHRRRTWMAGSLSTASRCNANTPRLTSCRKTHVGAARSRGSLWSARPCGLRWGCLTGFAGWLCTRCGAPARRRWNTLPAPGGLLSLSAPSASGGSSPKPPPWERTGEESQVKKTVRRKEGWGLWSINDIN